jgi:predicted O-methyltransferase YrrM
MKKTLIKLIVNLGAPLTFFASLWLKFIRKTGFNSISDQIFMKLGILPVLDHYYQPLINPKKHLTKSLRSERSLPGIDFNIIEQLQILKKFNYNEELLKIPLNNNGEGRYYYNNTLYSSGDAEYLYNMIRLYKPKRIIEIGSGFSTLIAREAISMNSHYDPEYHCRHICIEPNMSSLLKIAEIELINEKVENIDLSLFTSLESNDILFIDSSHIIRPQGDVLLEYLEVLPVLKSGVLVHLHDIFTPRDYLDDWIYERHSLWNEQYILEAFLNFNSEFRIIGALNYLAHNHTAQLADKCPMFALKKGNEKNKTEP